MTRLTLALAWPPYVLWPNGGATWRDKYRAGKIAKQAAYITTLQALNGLPFDWPEGRRLPVRLTFHPARNVDWDDDNAIAAMKHARDGVAKALRIDDALFDLLAPVRGEVVPGGCVGVELGEI